MGLAASHARLQMLTARKSDLELTGQMISQARQYLANMTSQMFNNSANLDPDGKEAKQLNQRVQALQAKDKSLELQLNRVDSQQKAVSTEMEAVKKVVDKNIAMTFKTFS